MKTVNEIGGQIGATVEGESSYPIKGVGGLEDATREEISFLANHKYARVAARSEAGAIVLGLTEPRPNPHSVLLRVENPSKAFALVCGLFAPVPLKFFPGVHSTAVVSCEAKIAIDASIQAGAVIEAGAEVGAGTVIGANSYVGAETKIGDHCFVYPNVTIRERCLIGNQVIIHSGAVIGADGFGFDISSEMAEKIPQIGIVRIDNRVEIGANTTIDRARFGTTWIQEGVKIDNLVQIAHNVIVGKNSLIAAQVGISGSTRIGQRVIIAGQAGVAGHVKIGDGAIIAAQSGVSKDVLPQAMVAGYHARPIREMQRTEVYMKKLPELAKRIEELEEQIKLLKERHST